MARVPPPETEAAAAPAGKTLSEAAHVQQTMGAESVNPCTLSPDAEREFVEACEALGIDPHHPFAAELLRAAADDSLGEALASLFPEESWHFGIA